MHQYLHAGNLHFKHKKKKNLGKYTLSRSWQDKNIQGEGLKKIKSFTFSK